MLTSFLEDKWVKGHSQGLPIHHAVNGNLIFEISSSGLDMSSALKFARQHGGPALRKMTLHQRCQMIKALATHLMEKKEIFYEMSKMTGATRKDSWIDIEGGIGTLFVISSKARRELPDSPYWMEGDVENISKNGTFKARHLMTPLQGVALHINAFNFPIWGMLEKLAPTLLAGMPAIIKPASSTSYLTHKMIQVIHESGILPPGALGLICGSVGNIFEDLTSQDVVTFTGSSATGQKLKSHPQVIKESIRFNMEADSLNFSLLGPDIKVEDEEFKFFVKEVASEMTVKTGQKCTAIRRILVPEHLIEPFSHSLKDRLSGFSIGNPENPSVRMGPLAGFDQLKEVRDKVTLMSQSLDRIYGDLEDFKVIDADKNKGAFFPWVLFHCQNPLKNLVPHSTEAFGPVSTLMGYKDAAHASEIIKLGAGSLVGSLFSQDKEFLTEVITETASYHGRLMVVDRHSANESTGHGSPLPHLVHGGPGRAGGGEELGGVRAISHYMQRTAIQSHPSLISHLGREWVPGSFEKLDRIHPFRKHFEEIEIGDTLLTHRRTVTEADVTNFAGISGDFFYAHTDELAASDSLFKKRVAHGYFVLSAAAGLFVDPGVGPVLANYGIDRLRFVEPVGIGDTISVKLVCQQKTKKIPREGEVSCGVVKWHVEVFNQDKKAVAIYSILTLVKSLF